MAYWRTLLKTCPVCAMPMMGATQVHAVIGEIHQSCLTALDMLEKVTSGYDAAHDIKMRVTTDAIVYAQGLFLRTDNLYLISLWADLACFVWQADEQFIANMEKPHEEAPTNAEAPSDVPEHSA